ERPHLPGGHADAKSARGPCEVPDVEAVPGHDLPGDARRAAVGAGRGSAVGRGRSAVSGGDGTAVVGAGRTAVIVRTEGEAAAVMGEAGGGGATSGEDQPEQDEEAHAR